jgi:hypothetical protein
MKTPDEEEETLHVVEENPGISKGRLALQRVFLE